ncbi:hypothetical protein K491DRAFT_723582 [Lophiostoma macrostomum CBS 122681]|uniref:Uncharacterized protein n=1 Tax=Lophiostoma macrostomum CBS 122681 TaxID=1314788 RepID=A0A6A6SJV6_9PLEO|nr:hypothetical protein K491DRAFT_723582 [Lophiostoma macrostomum CBS 122681]
MEEMKDIGFLVPKERDWLNQLDWLNELDWLNKHAHDMSAQGGQTNLDVFKTPGRLCGKTQKTPRTARKKNADPRQLRDVRPPHYDGHELRTITRHPNLRYVLAEHTAFFLETVGNTHKMPITTLRTATLGTSSTGHAQLDNDIDYYSLTPSHSVGYYISMGIHPAVIIMFIPEPRILPHIEAMDAGIKKQDEKDETVTVTIEMGR